MPELYQQDRLQPSLLDRLSDDEPSIKSESRRQRVISLQKFKQFVMRDLEWLLNTGCLESIQKLDEYPQVRNSVLNLGIPDFAGKTSSGVNNITLERILRQSILDFEPRILSKSLKVRVVDKGEQNTVMCEIEGELWWQPIPEHFYLKTILDLELGNIKITLER